MGYMLVWCMLLVQYLEQSTGLREWTMGHICGQTITGEMYGKLSFNIDDAQGHTFTNNKCTVWVQPSRVHGSLDGHRVMFYFTQFGLETCDIEYVSIVNHASSTPYIKGIPSQLCGTPQSLLRDYQYYLATDSGFNITYHVGKYSKSRGVGRFTVIFVSIIEDCGGQQDGLYHCDSTNFCVPPESYDNCTNPLRACGDGPIERPSTCDNDTTTPVYEEEGFFTQVIRFGVIVIIGAIVITFFKAFCEKCGEIFRGVCECISDTCLAISKCVGSAGTWCSSKIRYSICGETRPVDATSDELEGEVPTITVTELSMDTYSHVEQTAEGNDSRRSSISSSSVSSIFDLPMDMPSDLPPDVHAPPPSYNQAMSTPAPPYLGEDNDSINSEQLDLPSNTVSINDLQLDVDNSERGNDHRLAETSSSISSTDSDQTIYSYDTPPPEADTPSAPPLDVSLPPNEDLLSPPEDILPPPPSYEQAIAPSDEEAEIPGYHEYMANQSRYAHT